MGNVSWIKWNTDPSEIKELDDLAAKADAFQSKIQNTIDGEVIDVLNQDISSGGLDVYSLNIGGEAPANTKARSVVSTFNGVSGKAAAYANRVKSACKKQKQEEKEKLIEEIQKEQGKVKALIIAAKARISSLSSQKKPPLFALAGARAELRKLEEKERDLERRLNAAKAI